MKEPSEMTREELWTALREVANGERDATALVQAAADRHWLLWGLPAGTFHVEGTVQSPRPPKS